MGVRYPLDSPCNFIVGGIWPPVLGSVIYISRYMIPVSDFNVFYVHFFSKVEELYRRYKHSIPSERSESTSRRYFMALPERELSDDDMLYGERRDKSQIELELFILSQLLGGFKWNPEKFGRWFWQSKEDKDLVILRQWVEPNNNQSTI